MTQCISLAEDDAGSAPLVSSASLFIFWKVGYNEVFGDVLGTHMIGHLLRLHPTRRHPSEGSKVLHLG